MKANVVDFLASFWALSKHQQEELVRFSAYVGVFGKSMGG